jgi:hypothetical protein
MTTAGRRRLEPRSYKADAKFPQIQVIYPCDTSSLVVGGGEKKRKTDVNVNVSHVSAVAAWYYTVSAKLRRPRSRCITIPVADKYLKPGAQIIFWKKQWSLGEKNKSAFRRPHSLPTWMVIFSKRPDYSGQYYGSFTTCGSVSVSKDFPS